MMITVNYEEEEEDVDDEGEDDEDKGERMLKGRRIG